MTLVYGATVWKYIILHYLIFSQVKVHYNENILALMDVFTVLLKYYKLLTVNEKKKNQTSE